MLYRHEHTNPEGSVLDTDVECLAASSEMSLKVIWHYCNFLRLTDAFISVRHIYQTHVPKQSLALCNSSTKCLSLNCASRLTKTALMKARIKKRRNRDGGFYQTFPAEHTLGWTPVLTERAADPGTKNSSAFHTRVSSPVKLWQVVFFFSSTSLFSSCACER